MDCSLPGSCVHGILQARGLEWVPISFSRASSPPRNLLPSLVFTYFIFLVHVTFSCHVSLGFSWLWHFLKLSLPWVTLTVLRVTGEIFGKGAPPNWDHSDAFLMMRPKLWVLGRKITEVKGHSHHPVSGYLLSTWLTGVDVAFAHPSGWVFVRFSEKLPFPTLSILFSLCSPHLKGGPVHVAPPWEQNIDISYL